MFYHIPVSMQKNQKIELLLRAFNEGNIVVIDEVNSSPMLEKQLNNLLMGKGPDGKRPIRPGFMIIGTQNPVTMSGRQSLSTAMARRLHCFKLHEYSYDEMIEILIHLGISKPEAKMLVKAYLNALDHATLHKLKPAPTFRNLLRLATHHLVARARSKQELLAQLKSDRNNIESIFYAGLKYTDFIKEKIDIAEKYRIAININTSIYERSLLLLDLIKYYYPIPAIAILDANLPINPNACDNTGTSLLHYACRMENIILIVNLLELGVSATAKNAHGESVYDYTLATANANISRLIAISEHDENIESFKYADHENKLAEASDKSDKSLINTRDRDTEIQGDIEASRATRNTSSIFKKQRLMQERKSLIQIAKTGKILKEMKIPR